MSLKHSLNNLIRSFGYQLVKTTTLSDLETQAQQPARVEAEEVEQQPVEATATIEEPSSVAELLFALPKDADIFLKSEGLYLVFPESEHLHALSYLEIANFDKGLRTFITRFLKPGMTFIDIGANTGVMSAQAAQCLGTDGSIHAYEPISKLCEYVTKNITLNNPYVCHQVKDYIISNENGNKTLHISESDSRISTLFPYSIDDNHSTIEKEITCRTLDAELGDIEAIDLIKIDAEGAEFQILQGMETIIDSHQSMSIILEFSVNHFERAQQSVTDFMEFCSKHEFNLSMIDPLTGDIEAKQWQDLSTLEGNILLSKNPATDNAS